MPDVRRGLSAVECRMSKPSTKISYKLRCGGSSALSVSLRPCVRPSPGNEITVRMNLFGRAEVYDMHFYTAIAALLLPSGQTSAKDWMRGNACIAYDSNWSQVRDSNPRPAHYE